MVIQRPNPFPKSIYDNVAYGLHIAGTRDAKQVGEIVERSLTKAPSWDEVKDKLHVSALALSGGQQQRLCIARALRRRTRSPPARRTLLRSRSALDIQNRRDRHAPCAVNARS